MYFTIKKIAAIAGIAGSTAIFCHQADAQSIFRSINPAGRVTYSDKPLPDASAVAGNKTTDASGSPLPLELKKVAAQYPVVFYSGDQCEPCTAARNMLSARGIPFSEKIINSADDIQALQRLSGDASLPVLTIGNQQLKGYSSTEWNQYLDAAGYPKNSVLPSNFRFNPPAPLVISSPANEPPAEPKPAKPLATPRSAAPLIDESNPSGIRF